MHRLLRPIAVFGVAGAVTVSVGLKLAAEGEGSVAQAPHLEPSDTPRTAGFGGTAAVHPGYDLTRLKILEPTLYHVEESYVEPARIDWEGMYVAGLEAVERAVPSFRFSREAGRASFEIGEFHTVLEVPTVGTSRDLQQEVRKVAALLQAHLDPRDVRSDAVNQGVEPMAALEYVLVNGMLDTLDPHSILLPPADAEEMDLENQGEFGGLGITIVERDGRLVVEHPIPDTPAWAAGIVKEDVVTRIDGQSTLNMSLDEAVGLLRGPVDEVVELEIMREAFEAPRTFALARKLIKLNEVEGELLDGDVGLVHIQSFHSNVERELHEVLTRLHRQSQGGLKGLVLDLRDNPGGYLNQAVAVADTFLASGAIVSTVDGNGRKQDLEEARPGSWSAPGGQGEPEYPMVVLVNSNSASASEIVAGALRNNGRAVIVGERTFGKGSVQNLHQFYDESKLKLTISKYLTPGDRSIQAVGIPADIELLPLRIEERSSGEKLAQIYWRERARREADLDHSLEQASWRDEETAYRFRYVEPNDKATGVRASAQADPQVRFARDLLLGARSSRRAEMLGDAARVVDSYARLGETAVVDAMRGLGIDWSDGPAFTGGTLPVQVTLDLGDDDQVRAGVREPVTVVVTNTSSSTLYRVGVVALDNEVLSGREFLFGRLDPGQTRRYGVPVHLVDGYPTEHAPVRLSVRDAGGVPIGEARAEVRVEGRALPDFEWTWRMDDVTRGNGDGRPEVGEVIGIELQVRNRGEGVSGAAFARLKNLNGRASDLLVGTVEPGTLRDLGGAPCELPAKDCRLRLAPGERWTGRLEVELKEAHEDAWEFDLTLGDGESYDHASIVRAGFYEHFTQRVRLTLNPASPLNCQPCAASGEPQATTAAPPTIQVSRKPGLVGDDARVTVSGVVQDDVGVRHVMVFGGDDKLFYEGSAAGVRSVPFTADVSLELGSQVITVIAEDVSGLVSTRSIVTYRRDPDPVAARTP